MEAERARREQAIREARAKSPVVYTYDKDLVRGQVIKVTEYDIENGTWRQLVSDNKDRPRSDQELVVDIDGHTISFHLHGPKFSKGQPIPGGVMIDSREGPGAMQTPSDIIKSILGHHPRPSSWDT